MPIEEEPTAIAEPDELVHVPQVDEDSDNASDVFTEEDEEAVEMARTFLMSVLRLRGVKIDREHFLTTELHRSGISRAQIREAVAHGPAMAGVDSLVLEDVASRAVSFETRKSSGASFISGIPGGFAVLGTIPFDIAQYYVHALRIMQKLAYVYGWHDFLEDVDEVDDETLGILATFFGVMMGVGGTVGMLNNFLQKSVAPAVEKNIAKQALTKTAWYVPMKKVLKIIGINVTRQSFAKSASKVVPVIGGVISGGLTFTMLTTQSKRLKEHLRVLPPPRIDAADMAGRVDAIIDEEEEQSRLEKAGEEFKASVSDFVAERRTDMAGMQDQLGERASAVRDRMGTGLSSAGAGAARLLRKPFNRSADTDEGSEGDAADV